MKIPGRLWLQFEVDPLENHSVVRQTTVFDPAGYIGLAYWYLLYPVHHQVFSRMLRGLQRAMRHNSPAQADWGGDAVVEPSRRLSSVSRLDRRASAIVRRCLAPRR
jgi:hypothetical protein